MTNPTLGKRYLTHEKEIAITYPVLMLHNDVCPAEG